MTHVSGIKSIAGTEKILVPKMPSSRVEKKEGRWTKKSFQGCRPKADMNFTGCRGERNLLSLSLSISQLSPLLNTSCKSLGGP